MVFVNSQGYLEKTRGTREVFIVREKNRTEGQVLMHYISFPNHLVGRRVRFKVEIIEETKDTETGEGE
jgi:hypothetical protein